MCPGLLTDAVTRSVPVSTIAHELRIIATVVADDADDEEVDDDGGARPAKA